MSKNSIGTVRIRSGCAPLLGENLERILVLFAAILKEKSRCAGDNAVVYDVMLSGAQAEGVARSVSGDFIPRLQKYVDEICLEGCNLPTKTAPTGGEDSSYDSDCEGGYDQGHRDVSRTVSDTLAAEYADYVQQGAQPDAVSPGYNARVEFALKLGYTERHVQAALQKLGPSPTQNELLAELIKLGAQKGGSCDSSPTDSLVSDLGILDRFDIDSTSGPTLLRPIVVDGSNVAMSHGNKEIFSCRGIKICVDWFKARGHTAITVFVPKWRKEAPRPDNPVRDQEILAELERERLLVFTPSRLVSGKRMVCYDDRYILKLAAQSDGVVVSNDNYRDLCQESAEFRKVVEERILMYSFVNDHFMPPDDPLGRSGPTLDNFLRTQARKGDVSASPLPPPCPYGKKCTYGNKCKYHHPERGPLPHKSVTERLSEHAQRHLQARESKEGDVRKNPLGRTRSNVPPPKEPQPHAVVSKSRSVDNVGVLTASHQSYQPGADPFGFQTTPEKGVFASSYQPSGENLHRKLARQLTLNPGGGDPRLMTRRYAQPSPGFLGGSTWGDVHQGVTRIASAPDSYRSQAGGWPVAGVQTPQDLTTQMRHHMHRMSSCSDSQLNVWPSASGQWSPMIGAHPEDARRKLHYHLAAIFPEEQVAAAMQLYPDETNPQKICAAILAMFQNKS